MIYVKRNEPGKTVLFPGIIPFSDTFLRNHPSSCLPDACSPCLPG